MGNDLEPASPAAASSDGAQQSSSPEERPLDPEKLLRIASTVREVLEEMRKMDPDQKTVNELASLHKRLQAQLHDALPETLIQELEEIDLDLPLENGATGQEVRIAFSGLIGWLGGLFQGLQAAMQVQSMRVLEQQARSGQPRAIEEPPSPGRYL
jgi:proteasome activator-like protein